MVTTTEYKISDEVKAVDIPMDEIFKDDLFNCRGAFAASEVATLAQDIAQNGLQQPIVVQPYTEEGGFNFRILAGHRRFEAFKQLKRKTIPAVIREYLTPVQAKTINFVENIQRQNLNILQEAQGLQGLIDAGMNQNELADHLGVSTGWVQPRIWLLSFPENIQAEAAAGFLNTTHIRDLKKLPLISDMEEAVRKIKEAKINGEKFRIREPLPKLIKPSLLKKNRGTTDLVNIQNAIRGAVGNGLATRLVAWAIGEITDIEMYKAIKEEADKKGINYDIPKEFKEATI